MFFCSHQTCLGIQGAAYSLKYSNLWLLEHFYQPYNTIFSHLCSSFNPSMCPLAHSGFPFFSKQARFTFIVLFIVSASPRLLFQSYSNWLLPVWFVLLMSHMTSCAQRPGQHVHTFSREFGIVCDTLSRWFEIVMVLGNFFRGRKVKIQRGDGCFQEVFRAILPL